MNSQIFSPQIQLRDGVRPPPGSAGIERAAGSVPPVASVEVGPPNPRMRIDRDLGMVVIEFRDAAGRVNVSLPTPREIDAYRASILFGADIPRDVKGLNTTSSGPSGARPNSPMSAEPERQPAAKPKAESAPSVVLDKSA